MPRVNYDELGSMEFDVLKELGNIGAGNATTALSKLIGMKVDMRVPHVKLLNFAELAEAMGTEETIMVGLLVMLKGDVQGMMMFLMNEKVARYLVNILMMKGHDTEHEGFDEIELSAIKEIGNMIAGAYLSSLSDLTNLRITESVPYLQIDMAGAILSVPAIEFGKIGDKVLLIETAFEDEETIHGYYLLIPDVASYDKILASLGL